MNKFDVQTLEYLDTLEDGWEGINREEFDVNSLWCLEAKMFEFEADPLPLATAPESLESGKYVMRDTDLVFFESRGRLELELELDTLYEVLYEMSPGTLKHTYRMGYDIKTGKQVAVQFEFHSADAVTDVGDKKYTRNVIDEREPGKSTSEKEKIVDGIHMSAIDKVKATIRRYGHIDNVTKALKVTAIFDVDRNPMKDVKLIGLLNTEVVAIGRRLRQAAPDKYQTWTETFQSSEFQRALVRLGKTIDGNSIETYKVGQVGGEGKHKSTKLFWNIDRFVMFQYAPRVRGVLPNDTDTAANRRNYDLNNKPSRKK